MPNLVLCCVSNPPDPGKDCEHVVVCSTQEEHPKSHPQNTHISGFCSVADVLDRVLLIQPVTLGGTEG